jgi:PTS system ascorbate-specific IIA component
MKLSDLLTKDMIEVGVTASNWEEAIRSVGDVLIKNNKIDEQYVEDMIAAIHQFGPYIVLLPGFAFAHAQVSDAVKEDCMALVTLAEPVKFNHKTNDPVETVFAFGTNSKGGHMEIIQNLGSMLMDQENVRAISEAKNADEIMEIINKY